VTVPPTLFTLDGEAITTTAKAVALYKAHFYTTVTDIGGDTLARVLGHPVRVIDVGGS